MLVQGRCHCGEVAYSAEADPNEVSLCYCRDCQQLSGSTGRVSLRVRAADFVLHGGRLQSYLKTADSGARRVHTFCPTCGAPIYSAAEVDPSTYSLRVGCLAQRDALPPKRQQWMGSKPPWVTPLAGVEAFEKGAPTRKSSMT
jgi:hypothetical protein